MTFLAARSSRPRLFGLALFASFLVVGLDQASKWLMAAIVMDPPRVIPVTPFFNLVLGFNPGVSFGLLGDLGPWGPVALSGLTLAIVAFLVLWLWRTQDILEASALGLIIGGAVGNLIDRLRDGAVTDFLDFYVGQYHWPAFNLADTSISLGVAIILYRSFFQARRNSGRIESKQ